MSSTQKRGFRLPWTAERGPEDDALAERLATVKVESAPRDVRDDLGDGPFRRAEPTTPALTTDADPAASDVPDSTAEADMIDTDSPTAEPAGTPATESTGGWPTTDRPGSADPGGSEPASPRSAMHVVGDARVPRRENPLVAGLVKAMREAAIASRDETTNRLRAEAEARVQAIRNVATDDAANLRKKADDDIAEFREWSKAEIARIRQETEDRIEARRIELAAETERHAEAVERQVAGVESTVASFEADMDGFFEQLLAENDPARLATLAEQAPEPPDLTVEAAPIAAWADTTWSVDASDTPSATGDSDQAEEAEQGEPAEPSAEASAVDEGHADGAALEAAAAAEAEAEATEGLDMTSAREWPAAVLAAAANRDDPPAPEGETDGATHGRLLVSGLTSVAGISAFKGAIGGLAGVRSVSVSSGERGVFVFTVHHESDLDLGEAVAGLSGFAVRITEATGDSVSVTAHEPAA
jgi:hypothetical protein